MILIVFISIFAALVSSISCDEKPTFLKNLTTVVTVNEGNPAQLECYASGSPEPKIRWERLQGSTNQNSSMAKKSSIDGNVLNLSTTSKRDTGIYRCIAENGIGDPIELSFVLNVNISPRLYEINRSYRVGQRVKLGCLAEANPIATITWYKDNKVIDSADNTFKIIPGGWSNISSTVYSYLSILTRDDKHKGSYKCVIDNELGKAEEEFNVLEPIKV